MSNLTGITPADNVARERALQADVSFIVQAPAGSGKTGLLTQRYLKLLSIVKKPEEIIAITFTRKAAGEMRERILESLNFALTTDNEPENDYQKKTWHLARAALKQDSKQQWNLLEHTGRLRVQTIDSLCTELARQLPLLSEFGSVPGIIEDAAILYQEAALETLHYLESRKPDYAWAAEALGNLLQYQDNRMDKVQQLIADMLGRRDQWLRHVADLDHEQLRRDQIEPVLKRIVEQTLLKLTKVIPEILTKQLPGLIQFAASNVAQESVIKCCSNLQDIPEATVDELPQWFAIAELLLTTDNNFRKPKGVNIKTGFPAATAGADKEQKALFKEQKKNFQDLLEALDEFGEFKKCLAEIRILPHYQYSDDEWNILESLFKILLFSTAQLRIVFSSHGKVDFIEMLLAAKRSLGESEFPSELSLRLDYQLKHLLVDEFQDTSQNQFDLFTQLTSGWTHGDGRSLFLVGDPMQSIYRFREAEVGLFIQAWNNGLGDIVLEPLNLTVNFRSQKAIIDWVNSKFPAIFPAQNDKTSGAVCYTHFDAFKPLTNKTAVQLHSLFGRDDSEEAEIIINLIQQAQQTNPDGKIAVLCRNKSHLADIVALLNEKSLSYQAVEINVLNTLPVIQDLLSLSKALLHLADRIAWLALLRAPFIGLTLSDIHLLTFEHPTKTVLQCLYNETIVKTLSDDGQLRLQRIVPLITISIKNTQRLTLRSWIEELWLALGGPACCETDTSLADAEVYFQLLESLESEKELLDAESLNKHCQKLFALADIHASDKLQLMTIHKSKGLEFETVIIPGLGKTTASDKAKLLYWCERTSPQGYPELVFGPIKPVWDDKNKTTEYLKYLEYQKSEYEIGRLLYVAVTRAKQNLHLLGHVNIKSDGTMSTPASNSLLAQLWSLAEQQFIIEFDALDQQGAQQDEVDEHDSLIRYKNTSRLRLDNSWKCPAPPRDIEIVQTAATPEAEDINLEFDWAGDTAKHVGSIVHRLLEQLTVSNTTVDIKQISHSSKILLSRLGVIDEQLEPAVQRVITAIENTLSDKRGQWILSNEYKEAKSEFKITAVIDSEIRHMIIDRTFIDENDVRWIIDYKTGSHQGGGIDEFLDREQQRYESQLQNYANAMQLFENRQVKMALYFPMMQQWREW
ncbi:MAG: UvrD-helicase domain-containing protein [Gammaproteobacteria bacterium]